MRVYCVIVCYQPDVAAVAALTATLMLCDVSIVLVDNSETERLQGIVGSDEHCQAIWMGGNKGIAQAQNVGIRLSLAAHADAVLFLDQDSLITSDLIRTLVAHLPSDRPAVVAPVCVDKDSGDEMPSYTLNRLGLPVKVFSEGAQTPYPVDLVIASGSAATASTFAAAGFMNESLFIDFVDFEWSARCRQHGVPIHVVPQAVMPHKIGIRSMNLGPVSALVHTSRRTYYKVRNPLLLLRSQSLPKLYVLREVLAAWVSIFAVILAEKDKLTYIRMAAWGTLHGILNISGPMPIAPVNKGNQ